jgi:adenylyltransferase/sulfurtransferase
VPGTFGSLQALEALKLLLDLPGQLADELLMLDLLTLTITRVRTRRGADCPDHALRRPSATRDASAARTDAAEVELSFDSLGHAMTAGLEVIDIREPHEVARAATPCSSARHVPVAELLHGHPAMPPAGRYLLVCASGKRSLAAAQELRSRGYTEVFSLRGGIAALARKAAAATI